MPKLFSTFGEVRRRFASVRDQLAEELRRELGPGFLRSRGVGFMTYDMFGEPSEPRLENKRWAEFSAREFDYLISLVETMHAEVAEIRVCGGFDFSKTMQGFDPFTGDAEQLVGEFAIPIWTSFGEEEEHAKTKVYISRKSPSHVD
jgi:hypothetical protein